MTDDFVNPSALNQFAYHPRRCALSYREGEFAAQYVQRVTANQKIFNAVVVQRAEQQFEALHTGWPGRGYACIQRFA